MSVTGMDLVIRNLDAYRDESQRRAELAMTAVMAFLQGEAQAAAPSVTPQSDGGDSPGSLTGGTVPMIQGDVAAASRSLVQGVLTASLPADAFLALAKSGQWAFLRPIVERRRDEILEIIETVMRGGDASSPDGSST